MKWPCKRIQAPGDMESHRQSALTHFYQAQGLIQRPAGILKQVSKTLTPAPSSCPSGDPPHRRGFLLRASGQARLAFSCREHPERERFATGSETQREA